MQHFLVGTDLHQKRTAYDDVEFLSCVGGKLDRLALKLFGVIVLDPVGFCDLVLELGSQVLDVYAHFLGCLLSVTAPCDRVGCQPGRMSFKKIGDIDIEGKRAFVDEGERQVRLPAFIGLVLGKAQIGALRHGVLGKTQNLAHFPDTGGNFQKLRFRGVHNPSSCLRKQKKLVPKTSSVL